MRLVVRVWGNGELANRAPTTQPRVEKENNTVNATLLLLYSLCVSPNHWLSEVLIQTLIPKLHHQSKYEEFKHFFIHFWDLLYHLIVNPTPKMTANCIKYEKKSAISAYVHRTYLYIKCESRRCVSKACKLFQIQRWHRGKGEELCLFRPPLFTCSHVIFLRSNVVVVVFCLFRRTPWQKRVVIAGSTAARLGPL